MGLSISSRPVPAPQRAQGWLLVCHAVVRHTYHVSWHGEVGISCVAVTVSMHTICACTGNVRTHLLLPRFQMQPCRERVGKVDHVTRPFCSISRLMSGENAMGRNVLTTSWQTGLVWVACHSSLVFVSVSNTGLRTGQSATYQEPLALATTQSLVLAPR